MSLSTPRVIFGIHSITPYSRSTGLPYGTARVLSGSTFSLTGETIDLFGGSSKYSWQTEDGTISAELAFTLKEYPNWAMELFLGKKPSTIAASGVGAVSVLANKFGTSAVSATVGIDSIAAISGGEENLKFAAYTIKVASVNTVDLYASTNIDFARGTDVSFENDELLVEAGISIADTSATIALADHGLEITSGSGTIAMEIGDTATFEVKPINSGSTEVSFGSNTDVYPEFGCEIMAQAQGSGRMFKINILKVKAIGMPIGMTANEFSEAEISAKASYDSAQDAVFKIIEVEI